MTTFRKIELSFFFLLGLLGSALHMLEGNYFMVALGIFLTTGLLVIAHD